ncbi:AAA family ATPase [Bradyrhizobium sp.]|uniref:AAA family ATPase n=1 Tax=Bradyrhizobium sp. TaxID=376 RepID=UPI003BAF8B73
MTTKGLRLKSLAFHGPSRTPAIIAFSAGLNVVFGASNTGKSFIVDTIDYMLGGKGPLRDIPERTGYEQILLALETLDNQQFTLVRSTGGGAFRLHQGLFSDALPQGDGEVLADVHNDRREDNLSAYLLAKLDLSHKRVRRNKAGDTNSLSFRNLARLIIVNEEEIIQQRSPLSDGNLTADTSNTSVFKILLTGVDDSALVTAQSRSPEQQTRGAQLDLLDQLIKGYEAQIKELTGSKDELESQLDKLDDTMNRHGEQLALSESTFREASAQRRETAKKVELAQTRVAEITTLLDRFSLLQVHYRSDIERLRGIEEAGSLFSALSEARCPLCGASAEHHDVNSDCEANVDPIVAAAEAEIAKIEVRQAELADTITTLRKEAVSFERRLPRLEATFSTLSGEIERVIAPNLRELRSSYKQLADKGGEVREALGIYRGLKDFQDRKAKLEAEDQVDGTGGGASDVDLSTSVLDKFSTVVRDILKDWHFPDVDRVHFDTKARDLVINGKARTSFGKGLRAITQSAFTVGLMQFCRQNSTSHPGFVVLDSPLLSYREPDSAADDLRGTDLNDAFYGYLGSLPDDRQVIIVENTDPPAAIQTSQKAIKFTGIKGTGRAGYFPEPELLS